MHVHRRILMLPVAVALAAGLGAGAYAVGRSTTRNIPEAFTNESSFEAIMTGAQEVPTAGDPDGFGFAQIFIDTATDEICVGVLFDGIDDPTAMHIHPGIAGTAGGVVVDFGTPTNDPDVPYETCVAAGPVADQIAANGLAFYLNVHNATYPGGALRGQLQPIGSETRLLPTPSRVYDSRQPDSFGVPALQSNSTTVIDLSNGTLPAVPPTAVGALVTVTITDTQGAGFLTLYSNVLPTPPPTSTINWTSTGQDIAVTTTVKIDANGDIKATLGPNGATDLIIDVLGYLTPTTVVF